MMEQRVAEILRAADCWPEELIDGAAQGACGMLRARLRPGVTEEDCGGMFRFAAAILATAMLEELTGEGNVESFSAGEVRVKRYIQERFPKNAFWLLSPWLSDPGFGVKGAEG